MKAFVRLAVVMSVTALLGLGAYYGLEAGWGRLEPVEMMMSKGSDEQVLFDRVEKSLAPKLKKYEGQWLWDVPLEKVLADVRGDRRVQSVHVSRALPNRLKIEITPHRPVLAWVDRVGRFFPVANDASLLPALPAHEAPDLPILRGGGFSEREDWRQKAIEMVQELPADGLFSQKTISEIQFDPKTGFTLTLTNRGLSVQLGEGDYRPKASRVERVLNYLEAQQLQGRVIDARFAKKVVVRLRNAP